MRTEDLNKYRQEDELVPPLNRKTLVRELGKLEETSIDVVGLGEDGLGVYFGSGIRFAVNTLRQKFWLDDERERTEENKF